jgi:hypothetical protein
MRLFPEVSWLVSKKVQMLRLFIRAKISALRARAVSAFYNSAPACYGTARQQQRVATAPSEEKSDDAI